MAQAKAAMSAWKIFYLGFLAGVYISQGGTLAVSLGGQMGGTKETDPGLQKLVFGAFGLPFGLTMVIVCGAELVTGNFAVMSAGQFEGTVSLQDVLRNWLLAQSGNFIGSLFVVGMNLVCETFSNPASQAHATALAIAVGKSNPEVFVRTVARGFMCNWLVCIAVWQATAAQDIAGKILGIFWPICAFVAIGYEHVVANMFLIPMGMAEGADVTVVQFLVGNILPVTIGNLLAAMLMVGGSYSLMQGNPGKSIDNSIVSQEQASNEVDKPKHMGMNGFENSYDGKPIKNPTYKV